MSSIIQEEPADVVVLGLGVAGGIVATELAVNGYKVAGVTKGPYWDYANDFATVKYDEWGIIMQRKFDHPLQLQSSTLRNNDGQFALPMRRYTPNQVISLGHGVGGAAHHYAAFMGRYGPWTYDAYSSTVSKYGADFLNSIQPNHDMEDWPMSYDDYEPYYVEWEKAWGIAGTDQGPLVPMSANYPLPPHPTTSVGSLFESTTEAMGYHPYPFPNGLASQAYVNQYGVQVNACVYDGWCAGSGGCNYACETGAKANSAFRAIPAAVKSGNFSMALNSFVYRMDTDPATGNVTAARYYDAAGNIHVQPGKVFFSGMWGFNIARLMLTSGVGTPYNPVTVSGTVGRGLADGVPPSTAVALGTLNVGGNAYAVGNGAGGAYSIYDLADDNFDHTGLGFIGGNALSVGYYFSSPFGPGGPNNLAMAAGAGPQSMGSKYKASIKDMDLPTTTTVVGSMAAPEIPTTAWYLDLDPHYVDAFGDPLPRETLDFGNNGAVGGNYLAGVVSKIFEKMGAQTTVTPAVPAGTSHEYTLELHRRGGLRLGANPSTSVFNKFQQAWQADNFFAAGEVCSTMGNTVTAGTHSFGPECYVAAEGIEKYLQSPGALV
jgi:gluconate 2-dehydrogenase alpha chain